jgi:hypothetical protein
VQLPRLDQLAYYYAAVGVLVALEVIDWPVAVLIAADTRPGHRTP